MRAIALTHVFPRWDGDPSAAFLSTWAAALRADGHDVRVIAPHDAGLPEVDVIEDTPVRFVRYAPEDREVLAYRGEMHRIALQPTGPPLVASMMTLMAGALRRAVRRWTPDVVHVHWWMPGAIIARMARVDVPVVVHLHGTDIGIVEGRPGLRPLARWALDGADRLEVVSTSLARRTRSAVGRRVDGLNPMPLDIARFTDVEPQMSLDRPIVLGVGRLVPEKGFADLIDAVAGLEDRVVLRLVGDGPAARDLAIRAHERGVELQLPGRVDPLDLPAEYAAAEVVVQPSHAEGLGLVAAEAALMGRPIVATDSGGVRDVLDDQLLVRVGDVESMTARIRESLHDPDLPAVVRAGQRVRRTLSPEASARRTVDGWQQAIAAHRTRG
ncbi:glycosyltransferase [Euzebya rosea]|uniref:glycosyltransferase n=1 Tax=Euzebya rosea TaxID=2052804 RepID=UPI000D3E3D5C|nr:glycosyltransferase [Euzebya rosea]